jgi:hypothetical protein
MIAVVFVFFSAAALQAPEKETFQFKNQPELQQIKPKKPVKIRLGRSAKDECVWELTGDDAYEIVGVDRKLRKMLNVQ